MSSRVLVFEAREGGAFRISLTYETADGVGKSSARTDTYHGRFVELVRGERVVQTMSFETEDPAMKGEMKTTFSLRHVSGGTALEVSHEGVPAGISPKDNETGWRMALEKLGRLVEGRAR